MTDIDYEEATLFSPEEIEPWRQHWAGMPEFIQEDLSPWKTLLVHFASPGDLQAFSELIDQTLTNRTQSVWYPPAEIGHMANKRYIAKEGQP